MRYIFTILVMIFLVAGCATMSPEDTTPEPVEEPTTQTADDAAKVEQVGPQQMIPQEETIVKAPIIPKIPESQDTARPEPVATESMPDVSDEIAKQEANMESGVHILNVEGSDLIQDLTCDLNTNKLTFSLVSDLEYEYSLKKESVFNLPDDVHPMRFSLNGREIRDIDEKCGDTRYLKKGSNIQCEITFTPNSLLNRVMIRVGPDEFGKPLTNILHFASVYDQAQVLFVCRE